MNNRVPLTVLSCVCLYRYSIFAINANNSITNLEDLMKLSTFVDRTLTIKTFFTYTGLAKVQLITCPPKFGKTSHLNLLKIFTEKNNARRYENLVDSQIYKFLTNPAHKFEIALFMKPSAMFFRNNFKKLPTIYVSFNNVKGNTYEKLLQGMRECIWKCFESYKWLYEILLEYHNPSANNQQLPVLNPVIIMQRVLNKENLLEDDIVDSLWILSKTLFMFFKQHTFVLIDDYDTPIISAIECGVDIDRIFGLIRSIFDKLLYKNRSLRYALITGTTNVFDGTNFDVITHYSFADNHLYAKDYAFSEKNLNLLFNRHKIHSEELHAVKRYYSGYAIVDNAEMIYNPFSITNFIQNRNSYDFNSSLKSYWLENCQISRFLQYHSKNGISFNLISQLFETDEIVFTLKKAFSIEDLRNLQKVTQEDGFLSKKYHTDLFFSYLFHNGFLRRINESTYRLPGVEIEAYLRKLFVRSNLSFL